MSPQHTAPSRPFRWESRRELAPGPGSFLSSVWLCRLCHGGRGDLSWKEPAGWAQGRCVCPHRSAGPGVAMAEPPRWVCLDQGSAASLPSSSGPERGAGTCPVPPAWNCARNLPKRLPTRSWARPTFQERTWSIEGLQNFPEAALGLEAVLTAVHLAGEGAGEPRGGPGCREASDRQATLPSVSLCLSSD